MNQFLKTIIQLTGQVIIGGQQSAKLPNYPFITIQQLEADGNTGVVSKQMEAAPSNMVQVSRQQTMYAYIQIDSYAASNEAAKAYLDTFLNILTKSKWEALYESGYRFITKTTSKNLSAYEDTRYVYRWSCDAQIEYSETITWETERMIDVEYEVSE